MLSLYKLAVIGILFFGAKDIYHIQVQGSTQLSCKITHKATSKEPYILFNCEYRCDRPVASIDAKKQPGETIMCHADQSSPAGQGQIPADND